MFSRCWFFALLALSYAAEATAQEFSCFERTEKKNVARIVGPNGTYGLREYPWMVNLAKNGRPFCGGSLINKDLVLTAAHCIASDSFVVRRSTVNGDANGVQRAVKAVLVHEQYNSEKNANDVALIRLDLPFDISAAELPRMLPNNLAGHWGQPNDCARVIGWGRTKSDEPPSKILLGTDVPLWPNSDCRKSYSGINSGNICAGYKDGKSDSCQGDSGGPLFVRGGPTSVYLVGVVSYGRGCGDPNFPGVYARVSEFSIWVHQKSNSVR